MDKGGCVFYFASLVDLVHAIYVSAIILFFLFLRAEYRQYLEEEYWRTLGNIQVRQ